MFDGFKERLVDVAADVRIHCVVGGSGPPVLLLHDYPQSLGFDRFHMVGHDRGGRTGHRMALDRLEVVQTLTVMDIAPTYTMFMDTNRHVAGAYWHWYFLSLPAPFPERIIGADLRTETLPGAHFFVDQFPKETAAILGDFLR